jgi:hypothetical protein
MLAEVCAHVHTDEFVLVMVTRAVTSNTDGDKKGMFILVFTCGDNVIIYYISSLFQPTTSKQQTFNET